MNVYYFIGRLVSPVVGGLFYFYSLLTNTPRARVVVKNEDGEVLLIQAWPNTSTWGLPGGGVKRSEKPEEAASRELREETGIEVLADKMKQSLTLYSQGHDEVVYVTAASKDSLPAVLPNKWEIRRAEWFPPHSLPNVSPAVHHIVDEVAAAR